MNGEFKTMIMDRDAIIAMFDLVVDEDGNKIAIAMDGKGITRYDEEIEVYVPTTKHSNKIGTTRGMSLFQKRGHW